MGERREEGGIFRIGSVAGLVGALLAMDGNLLHPATPIGDPEGAARTIAESETWVLVHLVIVVGLMLMLGGLGPSPARSRADCLAPWPGWGPSPPWPASPWGWSFSEVLLLPLVPFLHAKGKSAKTPFAQPVVPLNLFLLTREPRRIRLPMDDDRDPDP